MPYNEELEEMTDALSISYGHLGKKKMFGGICYLTGGNMCFGIYKDFLIVRIGDMKKTEKLLSEEGCRPFDITGRPMKGWLMVNKAVLPDLEVLRTWTDQGLSFAKTLPEK